MHRDDIIVTSACAFGFVALALMWAVGWLQ